MDKKTKLTAKQKERYSRNILLEGVGEEGQAALFYSRVLIVGLGGLGSPALYYLAAAGVGRIGIADPDTVGLSNLQRQILHREKDLGRPKTESAGNRVRELNPDVQLDSIPERLTTANARSIIKEYDFIIEATDNFSSKFLVNDTCVALGKPFSHAGILGMMGQTMTCVPGRGPCYRCVFEDVPRPGDVESTDQAGVLGSVAGIMGSIQATEAVKYILGLDGLLTGRLLTFDGVTTAFRELPLNRQTHCPACGEKS